MRIIMKERDFGSEVVIIAIFRGRVNIMYGLI